MINLTLIFIRFNRIKTSLNFFEQLIIIIKTLFSSEVTSLITLRKSDKLTSLLFFPFSLFFEAFFKTLLILMLILAITFVRSTNSSSFF